MRNWVSITGDKQNGERMGAERMDLALLPIGHSNELSSLASAVKHLLIRGVETCVGRREISWMMRPG